MPLSLNVSEPEPTADLTEHGDNFTCYSLRISNQSDKENEYILFFQKWLKEKLIVNIVKSSAGIHNDTKVPHFHYHAIVNEPDGFMVHPSKSGTQGFRNYFKLKEHKDNIFMPLGNDLKVSRKVNQCMEKCLKYPLKCGIPIPIGCSDIHVPTLVKLAQKQFETAPTRVFKKKKSDLKTKCLEYLDSRIEDIKEKIERDEVPEYCNDIQIGYKTVITNRLEAYQEAITLARHFYIKEDPESSPNTAGCLAMKWLNGRGILSDRDYIRMYSPISRLM